MGRGVSLIAARRVDNNIMYNGTMFESVLKLQQAYEQPIQLTEDIPSRGKVKGQFACRKFPPCTPKHNRTNVSFEETKRRLKELDNDPAWTL